jgi:hypothetical protein
VELAAGYEKICADDEAVLLDMIEGRFVPVAEPVRLAVQMHASIIGCRD